MAVVRTEIPRLFDPTRLTSTTLVFELASATLSIV
jgi:hypothetical protein